MNVVLRSPGIYCQLPGAVKHLEKYIAMFGKKALLVSTIGSFERYGSKLISSNDSFVIDSVIVGKETTQDSIDKVIEFYNDYNSEVIIGFGGGKTLDTARAAADVLNCPLIIIPTVASNDAPCSALSIIHDDFGAVLELRTTKRNPDVVLVDTDILIDAPERLFVAGMGDALATYFEANACTKSGAITLAIMILPLIMRTTEEALIAVPDTFREGSFGLGAGKLRTVFKIVLPSAVPGILAGVILSIGRIVGESAALIFTAGTNPAVPDSLFASTRTLSVHMYALLSEGLYTPQAYATAVVLLVVVIGINALSGAMAKKLSNMR